MRDIDVTHWFTLLAIIDLAFSEKPVTFFLW